jgi:N-acetyl-anhydromuramyl-L-alanine amidase AmpD
MAAGLTVERHPSPNCVAGRGGQVPRGVVVHTTDGTFAGALSWLTDPESRVSAHYLVSLEGRVVQLVDERDTARHAGRVLRPTAALVSDENPNPYTVGLEFEDGGDPMEVERPPEQYAAGASLLRGICDRWEIPLDREHVIGHREVFAAKACPGNLDIERLIAAARGDR